MSIACPRGSLLLPLALACLAGRSAAADRNEALGAAVEETIAAMSPVTDPWRTEWEFTFWMPVTMKGTSTVEAATVPLDYDVGDATSSTSLAVGTRFESWLGDWGGIIDIQWGRFESSVGEGDSEESARIEQFVMDFGLAVRAYDSRGSRPFWFDLIAIGRAARVDQTITPAGGSKLRARESYGEAVFGARATWKFSDRWWVGLRADVGGFGWGAGSRLTYNILLGFGVELGQQRGGGLKFGWKYFDIDYVRDRGAETFAWNATLQGPFVAYTFVF